MKFETFLFSEAILLIIIAGVIIFGGLLSSCGGGAGSEIVTANDAPTALHRIVDKEAGVACFYIVYSGSVAMDCVPLSDTKLFQ